jgi:hypothetical protein
MLEVSFLFRLIIRVDRFLILCEANLNYKSDKGRVFTFYQIDHLILC